MKCEYEKRDIEKRKYKFSIVIGLLFAYIKIFYFTTPNFVASFKLFIFPKCSEYQNV